jgi:hypothetical protein
MRIAVVRAISFFAREHQLCQYPFRTVAVAFGYILPPNRARARARYRYRARLRPLGKGPAAKRPAGNLLGNVMWQVDVGSPGSDGASPYRRPLTASILNRARARERERFDHSITSSFPGEEWNPEESPFSMPAIHL